ncbi:hypothetical protein [Pedobacter sp.]|uniref:hypothetical protein n=1 Tax=Pedobacter sp. TaxID=1411316 RepID=UPI003C547864
MNEIFEWKRFSEIFKKHTAENYKSYLMSTAVLIGGLGLILSFIGYTSQGHISVVQQGMVFLIMMFLSGSVFTSMIFSDLGDRKKAIPMLTLPASHLEKTLVGWVYAYLLFQVVYMSCFYLVDTTIIHIANRNMIDKNVIVNVFSTEDKFWIAFPQFAILNAICFVGAIWFDKMHFIKTGFVFLIFVLLLTAFNYTTINLMFDTEVAKAPPFNSIGILEEGKFWRIKGNHQSDMILLVTVILVSTILWISGYFRLKEKQV